MIELKNVSISVHGRRVLGDASGGDGAAAGCTATLPTAAVTHLAGVNGSGKTTLIRAIAGIQRYSGSILFDGAEVARVRSRLYVCWDDAAVFPYLNGYENIRMLLGRPLDRSRVAAIAPALAGHSLLRMTARGLSHGQRKRLHLVAALLSGADYLILDEALNGVDAPTINEVSAALAQRAPNATVLVTGHHDDAYDRIATQRLSIVGGLLVAQSPEAESTAAEARA